MGCVSSKSSKKDVANVRISCPRDTCTTYGLLNLDHKQTKSNSKHEVINAWELMDGLEDTDTPMIPISTKSRRSPMRLLNHHIASPRKVTKSPSPRGKENELKPRNTKQRDKILPEKCPPGGEGSVVLYTTSLRGIRKTYEECNRVRSVVEAHGVRVKERDVSMDSGFKEELRGLTGRVAVPVVFVKGRVVGGVNEVVRMEEEGQLGALLQGVDTAVQAPCHGCGGFRFVVCGNCNGSCKVLHDHEKVRCGRCNENGLLRCSICCC